VGESELIALHKGNCSLRDAKKSMINDQGEGQLCEGNNVITEEGMCFGVVFQYKLRPG